MQASGLFHTGQPITKFRYSYMWHDGVSGLIVQVTLLFLLYIDVKIDC